MDIKVEITDNHQLCPACLCIGRTLHSIKDDKLRNYYLSILYEIPLCIVPIECPNICWECTALLKKTVLFREIVKDSFRILQTYTNENLSECLLTEVSRAPCLQPLAQYSISIDGDLDNVQLDVPTDGLKDGKDGEVAGAQVVFVKDETKQWAMDVKQERPVSQVDNQTDCSDDVAQLEIEIENIVNETPPKEDSSKKKKERKKKKLDGKTKTGKKPAKSLKKKEKKKPQQKILSIDLSYEEMMQEREKESQRESFLRAEYRCESCVVPFSYHKSYTEHMANKHALELGNYSCPVCKTVIASVDSFTTHYKRHLRRYECASCGKRTMDRKAMQQHYETTHELVRREYKCAECDTVSATIAAHRYHKASHRARVECGECDKTFSHRAGLMNHRIAVHKLNNVFPCSVCDKVFRWKTSLKKHMGNHDRKTPERAVTCTPCGVHFASICNYQRHLRHSLRHVTPEQHKFICDHCSRRFANKTKLRDHIEEKHLHKTYQCHICLKPSKNRVCLDQHIRNVHRGRPNNKMCHHCGKGFPTKVQLESHIRSHTGERPFICEYCPTTFSQQSNLYKHNRLVHLNVNGKGKKSKDRSRPCAPAVPEPPNNHSTISLLSYNPEKQFIVQYDGDNVTIV